MNTSQDILTTKECAEFLRIHPNTVIRFAKKGDIPHIRIGNVLRFSRAALEAYAMGAGRGETQCQMESINAPVAASGGPRGPTGAAQRIANRLGLR